MSKEISQYNNWETQSNLKLEHDPRISALDPMRDEEEEEEDDYPKFANWWCATRYVLTMFPCRTHVYACSACSHYFSEAAAEFMGVMVLIIFGNGAICQVVLSGNTSVTTLPHGVRSPTSELSQLLNDYPLSRTGFLSVSVGLAVRQSVYGFALVSLVLTSTRR
jgi:hypothetical protein